MVRTMRQIIVKKVMKKERTIIYDFSVTEELKKYFSGAPFIIEYTENIESVPDAIAIIPFVCNVLPIIWLTDSSLVLYELDEAFYKCIPNVKKGYETMFPESEFKGEIKVDKVVPCDVKTTNRKAMFYSGGLDSIQTLISHIDEKPDLISIWGSDIKFDNKKGWELVYSAVKEAAEKYGLKDVTIHSNFRGFDNEGALDKEFHVRLKDGWWHGVKHGIGLLGHVAPYAYLNGLSTMYIASSNCPADGHVRCASNPLIDNQVRFVKCQVSHDGFEFSRQDKIHNVVQFCKKNNYTINMHVCWESQSGNNCCRCEKCFRTIAGIIAEGADPKEYGFKKVINTIGEMQSAVLLGGRMNKHLAEHHWKQIHDRMLKNKDELKKSLYWKDIKWILHSDFLHIKTLKMPLIYRIKQRIYANSIYRFLHKVKVRIRNGKK